MSTPRHFVQEAVQAARNGERIGPNLPAAHANLAMWVPDHFTARQRRRVVHDVWLKLRETHDVYMLHLPALKGYRLEAWHRESALAKMEASREGSHYNEWLKGGVN